MPNKMIKRAAGATLALALASPIPLAASASPALAQAPDGTNALGACASLSSASTERDAAEAGEKAALRDLEAAQAAQGQAAARQAASRERLAAAKQAASAVEDGSAAEALSSARDAYDSAASAEAQAASARDDAAAAGEAAAQKLADGAFAFFEDMGAADALEVLNSKGYCRRSGEFLENRTVKGSPADASSVGNMLNTIKYLRQANEIRAAEGCPAYSVTLIDTAYAIWDANWSDQVLEHAGIPQFRVDENLAWGWSGDPFYGWYTQEKANYEAKQKGEPLPYPDDPETGHYIALIQADEERAGFAINTKGTLYEACYSLVMVADGKWRADYGAKRYTVDEYEELLTGWVDEQNKLVDEASSAAARAEEAASAREKAAEALAAAQAAADANAVAAELSAATAEADEAASALAQANADLDAAQEAYASARAEAVAARAAYYAAYPFPDVDMSQYYADGAYYAAVNGLMSGYDNGRFGPNDTLTRGQLATILWRTQRPGAAAAYDEAGAANETGMGDVEAGKFYTAAANWAVSAGVINGFEVDGHREFRPYEAVTMEQLACIMANLAGAAEDYDASGLGARYVDASSISTWAASSVAYGGDRGWFSGYENPDGTRELKPYEALSRGRAATMLMNMGVK